jgi:hypothetical protein
MRTIEIVINPKGETKVQTPGFAGSACRDASRFIEQALGQQIGERLTAEFHSGTVAEDRLRQQS